MKHLLFCIGFFLLAPSLTYAQDEETNTKTGTTFRFVNNTGRDVTDLHIIFTNGQVELVDHDFPTTADKKVVAKGPNNNGSGNRWDLLYGKLPNKGIVSLTFKAEAGEIRIDKWQWTFDNQAYDPNGDHQRGTTADDKGLDRDLIGPNDKVGKLRLKQPYGEKKRNGKTKEFGVNDLHIVTRVKPEILNDTKKGDEDPRAGGVFRGRTVIECDCPNTERERYQLDQPCESVCKGQTGKLYILQLDDPAGDKVKKDSIVTLELKHLDAEDQPIWYWWTKDGKQVKGEPDDPKQSGGRGDGVPADDGHTSTPSPKSDWKQVESVAYIPPAGDGAFCFGLTVGAFNSPFDKRQLFSADGLDEVQSSLFNTEGLYERLFERLGGEFFIGSFSAPPAFQAPSTQPEVRYGLTAGMVISSRLKAQVSLLRSQAGAGADFPVTVFGETGTSLPSLTGRLEVDRQGWRLESGLELTFGERTLAPLAGAWFGLATYHQQSRASLAGEQWLLADERFTQLSYGLRAGMVCRPGGPLNFALYAQAAREAGRMQLGVGVAIGLRTP